jgi:CBS domain-containing protein
MRNYSCSKGFGIGLGLAMLSPQVLASQEEVLTTVAMTVVYACIFFLVVVIAAVYFMRLRDKREAPLRRVFTDRDKVHSVAPATTVIECVRTMTERKVGAMIVMDGDKLVGIFTERDALNKVLAAGLDPVSTKVSEVMTKDPFCMPPTTTVASAMEMVTKRRFRHLPIVENGKVLAVISSGDLTHWLVKDQVGEVQELIDLAARS